MQYRSPEQPICEDFVFHASDDQRPNTGLREGLIHHSDVNETIRMNAKAIIFGQ